MGEAILCTDGVAGDHLVRLPDPIQSHSAFSWSNTTLERAPSTSIQRRFLRPGDTWLTVKVPDHAVACPKDDAGGVLGVDCRRGTVF